jgi:alcohol dehydrogenase, propanol-preferring
MHLGVQYARHMGFEVAAIGRGADKDGLARKLGAHHYIDSSSVDPGQALKELGGVAAMIETVPLEKAPEAYSRMMAGRARLRMVLTMQP